jgi:GNAT superfamily N-acetyltransferase
MEFVRLTDLPSALPTVTAWYFDHWGHRVPGDSLEGTATRLRSYLNPHGIPLMVIALDDGEVVGAAQLKFREMTLYPDREHWLGGVFVRPTHRGKALASHLVTKTADIARSLQVRSLYLQTERLDGGLYARLGWEPCEQVTYKGIRVLVMERSLNE